MRAASAACLIIRLYELLRQYRRWGASRSNQEQIRPLVEPLKYPLAAENRKIVSVNSLIVTVAFLIALDNLKAAISSAYAFIRPLRISL